MLNAPKSSCRYKAGCADWFSGHICCEFSTSSCIYIVALWKGSSHLEPIANPSISRSNHCYLALKLTIIPLVSLFIYFTTFAHYTVIYIAFHTVVFITPLLFLVLKLIFGRRETGVTIAWTHPSHGRKLRDQKKGASETVPLLTA